MKRLLILLLIVVCGVAARAKDTDFNTWTAITAKVKIAKGLSASGTLDYRTRQDASSTDWLAFRTAINYQALPHFSVGGGYELQLLYRNGWNNRHRYQVQIGENLTAGRFDLSLRERFQHTIDSGDNDFVLRTRAQAKYKATDLLRPYASVEFHNSLNSGDGFDINFVRYIVGLEFKLNKTTSIAPYYCLNTYDKQNRHTAAIDINFNF
ncbi:MAG: DUF2490 domain-containing protein [Bacteroidales bacterium]|nr:DUF2490 domain-containing protein [Bacteroidales bacterium]